MAVHNIDPAFNALDLDTPETVEATAVGIDEEICREGVLVNWRFPARGKRGPLSLHWYDGGLRPPTPPEIDPDDPKQRLGDEDNGILFVGERGYITCAGWSGMPRLLPLERHRGARLTELVLLGNVALRTRKFLRWDAPGMRATNAPEADPHLRGSYRPGWEIPA